MLDRGYNPEDYFWTYKNSFININYSGGRYISSTITYCDRKIENLLKANIKKQMELEEATEKHREDSIRKAQEEEERIEKERKRLEKLKRDKNHKKSIEQI